MLEIKTADELVDAGLEGRWARHRGTHHKDVLRRVLRAFVEGGGPVGVDEIAAAFRERDPGVVRQSLLELDRNDLIQIKDGRVEVAYPFSARPTPFAVQLPDGRQRYACCAIDALGMAPMLQEPLRVRSRCHHCGAPLGLSVTPDGPGPDARDIMVWIGTWRENQGRIATTL